MVRFRCGTVVVFLACCVGAVLSDTCYGNNSTVIYCSGLEFCCGADRCCSRDYSSVKIAVATLAGLIILVKLLLCYISRRKRKPLFVSVRLRRQSVMTVTVAPPTVPQDADSAYNLPPPYSILPTATSSRVITSTKLPYKSLQES